MGINARLWTVQGLLAVVFLFSGVMKLVLPIEAMAGPISLPGVFLRFLGVAEVAGALGLILPGLLKVQEALTPLAAGGLVIIMIGATVITAAGGAWAGAIAPFAIGLLSAWVGERRRRQLELRQNARLDLPCVAR